MKVLLELRKQRQDEALVRLADAERQRSHAESRLAGLAREDAAVKSELNNVERLSGAQLRSVAGRLQLLDRRRAAETRRVNELQVLAERLRREAVEARVSVRVLENVAARRLAELEKERNRKIEREAEEVHRALRRYGRDDRSLP